MADTTWQHELLRHLHHVFHVSLSLKPVSADFNLTTEYLQSLMMIVAGGLALGFSVLVMLALFLCLVISYAAPSFWPSWPYRILVVATAVALVATASNSLNGSHHIEEGLDELDGAIRGLQAMLVDVRARTLRSLSPSPPNRPLPTRAQASGHECKYTRTRIPAPS